MPEKTEEARAVQLRGQVVDELIADGAIVSSAVANVLRSVPRHLFAPEASLEDAYSAYSAVITKRDGGGSAVSSVSAPQVQAFMLEQAEIRAGMRVLEIGSGGLNAAYLAELVGESGEVTTVDIDPEVTDRASRLLKENGYPQVRVVTADAHDGVPTHGPYDRIIVTVGAWDVPSAWTTQLTGQGRIVVPLRMRGLMRSVALQRISDHLVSTSARICGFVPMQGTGARESQVLLLTGTDEITLRFDDGLPADPNLLDNALRTPRVETWTGVTVRRGVPVDSLQLYLATVLPGFCTMAVSAELDTGLVAPYNKRFSLAAVSEDGRNLAYITPRLTADGPFFEYGAHALGPEATAFADEVAGHLRAWDQDHRGGPGPRITVYPAGTPDDQIPELADGRVIDKKHSRVALSWPMASAADQDVPLHPIKEEGE
ncbi:methyltransferase, FxLD system [Streptomyces sp. SID4919]|uniref:methyltransferase, FxLD system n=1 Tax=unclassified Streptomyces TaxID=2593676 RepID=UPI000823D219|nr:MULTISPECIES: methyltransferase, FxLD system [unclassified Streptomyces]MYY10135.1 methyltransferase, FxLD system [Streptomyces sp. SID4919]SCK50809.1 protein-L-isoaspartate(D-aspartate) O-methyltransferase [Streptomyces sp. AmelKG-E11A]